MSERYSILRPHEQEIVSSYNAGENSVSLAKRFGVTSTSVLNFLHKRGVVTRVPSTIPADREAEVLSRYEFGEPMKAIAQSMNVAAGAVRSVLKKNDARIRHHATKHGMFGKPEYTSWRSMLDRCFNKNHKSYAQYGGAGITVCVQWVSSFENFFADMGPRPSLKYSLDRYPDPFGNYEPGNCRWATVPEQGRNKRNNRLIEFNGKVGTCMQWQEWTGLSWCCIYQRVFESGWAIEKALTTPSRHRCRVDRR